MQIPILKPIYKRRIGTHKYIQVGVVNAYGLMDFDTPNDREVFTPNRYYPEFYIDVKVTKDLYSHSGGITRSIATVELGLEKKPYNPQNVPQEVKIPVPCDKNPNDYNVTGYVTDKGTVVYYDQYDDKR